MSDDQSRLPALIQVVDVSKSCGSVSILERIGFEVAPGEFFGIIGPNGSGKSTLLQLLSAVEKPDSGQILLKGKPSARYTRKELARWMAVLQQDAIPPISFTVREVVEMGRYPFQNWLGDEQDAPAGLIDSIMERLGLAPLADRSLDQLSGGERQRVALGKAMAQQPQLLMLDEPTTYLDIGYQIQLMDYVRDWQQEAGLTVVAVLHDLNLAALYCDRILVLKQGQAVRIGKPEDIMRDDIIASVYGTVPLVVAHPDKGTPQILLQPGFQASV